MGFIMKLIYAVVNNDDGHAVLTALTKAGYSATKLASSGGFLKSGNSTFMICSEDENVDDIVEIIKNRSRMRMQYIPAVNAEAMEHGGASSFPIEVSVGGATIFVTTVERFEKL
jgi:uncharacterized protein YaaQ